MMKPLIGITTNSIHAKNIPPYDRLAHAYIDSIISAGGIPVLLPNHLPGDEVELLRKRLDGIVLSGGGDIDALRYSGAKTTSTRDVSKERDDLEFRLVQQSVASNWPLLGICRGIQMINVALGGTLYTDIPTQYNSQLVHDTPKEKGRDYPAHEVTIINGTALAGILKKSALMVNSFHHQAVKQPAPALLVSAKASDGLIEGLELPGQRFFVGVQWHPECLPAESEQRALFNALIRAA